MEFAVRGTLVHCPSLGTVQVLRDYLLGNCSHLHPCPSLTSTSTVVDDRGIISHLSPATKADAVEYIKQNGSVRTLSPGSFLIPTFCDLHLHAPQFMYQGTGLDLPVMQWLDKYAYKAEEALDARPDLARTVYTRLAQRLIEVGTGAVLLFGTINSESKYLLSLSLFSRTKRNSALSSQMQCKGLVCEPLWGSCPWISPHEKPTGKRLQRIRLRTPGISFKGAEMLSPTYSLGNAW